MNRRSYLQAVGGVVAGVALAGCTGGSDSTGTLATEVSDQPGDIGDFESCVVTITEIRVKPSDASTEDGEEDAEESIDVNDEEADLVELQGDESALISEEELETGEYDYLKLTISNVEATLDGGGDSEVNTPGDAPLKFNTSFEISEGTTTRFTADFTPVKQGTQNRYVLQPVAQETDVSYE